MPLGLTGAVINPLLLLAAAAPVAERPFDPTSAYEVRTVQKFTVLVNRRLLGHEREAAEVLDELESQLKNVAAVVPVKPLAQLRKVRFWVEWDAQPDKAAEFHPSVDWLREHGYNPEKAGCVEIANARNFVKWSHGEQPWAALHELAHSYHFRVLGEDHDGVLKAYRQAMARKLYDSVRYVNGGEKRAYAASNPKEYFAELSEGYFGKNDFYPFTRDELKQHDPAGYRLMQQVWGQPRARPTEPAR